MLDLVSFTLPDAVTVNGRVFLLKTNFRDWLLFDRVLSKKGLEELQYADLLIVLDTEEVPYLDELEELTKGILEFYSNQNPCPKNYGGGGGSKVMDYDIDSDYIFAAFLEQYGIDLCDIDYLHWHKFLALLRGLSDDTMLGKIMSYRGYKNTGNKSYEKQMKELKAIWDLPTQYTEEEKQQMQEFDDYFG